MFGWILKAILASVFVVAPMVSGLAQTYPIKPVRIIVPFAAGGITDIVARQLAQQLTERWGQQVIVENRPGGSSQLGAELVMRALADGYTLLVSADTTFVMNPHLYRDAKIDPLHDFTPITGLGVSPQALVVHPGLQVNTMADLVKHGKAKPGELNFGTFGIGSSGHLNIEMLGMATGARFTPVHYRGAAPAITDLLGGHIHFMMVSIGLIAEAAKDARLKVIAVGSESRLSQLPDAPTLSESGLKGFETGSWYGLVAPKGTPPDIITKISSDSQAIFNDPAFQRRALAPSFIYSIASEPSLFAQMMRRESDKWKKVITEANIKAE